VTEEIRIGVSSCLLGEQVRYDGGQKHDACITGILGGFFTFVPVCPEVGCGLTVPREAMRLEGDPARPRLVVRESRLDLTGRMLDYCRSRVLELEREGLCGFIFKKRSPSCGLHRVTVYDDRGIPAGNGRGLFAAAVTERFPLLPVEEEEGFRDPALRENFIERVFAFRRGQEFRTGNGPQGELTAVHNARKLQLMARSLEYCQVMGKPEAEGNV
jgi:uncharacterized protein YbbK (DUF523 family)